MKPKTLPDYELIFPQPFAILENTKQHNQASYFFYDCAAELCCYELDELNTTFAEIQKYQSLGYYLVGYSSYECGYAFVANCQQYLDKQTPQALLRFVAFKQCIQISANGVDEWLAYTLPSIKSAYPLFSHMQLNADKDEFVKKIHALQQQIRAGNTYQVNYTVRTHFNYQGHPLALYQKLRQQQPVEYSAYLTFDNETVLSLSPELFFRKNQRHLLCKPMKGTAKRPSDPLAEIEIADQLHRCPKNRAENLMIVDLVRNDLSRIAHPGSVEVPQLFEIEAYKTVMQMTSTITCRVDANISLAQLWQALYPCGSITGAPKKRTMEIIYDTEPAPRGIYTGAIGYIMPNNDMCFNIPIRTAVLDHQGAGVLGIGSGIVADSDAEAEYEETLLKGRFLTAWDPGFALIETLRYQPRQGYHLFTEHCLRLMHAATRFNFVFDLTEFQRQCHRYAAQLPSQHDSRVRIRLSKCGELLFRASALTTPFQTLQQAQQAQAQPALLAPMPLETSDTLFHYKSTVAHIRDHYDQQLAQAKGDGFHEVLFHNHAGKLTEGAISNIVIEQDGQYLTPPISDGCLPGILRDQLCRQGLIQIQSLSLKQCLEADAIYSINSVRGWTRLALEYCGE